MRLSIRSGNPAEWLALRFGLVPAPAAESWGGMALAGVLVAAVRTGITERLAGGPATLPELASDLDLDLVPLRLLLECLRSAGYVMVRSGRYGLSRSGRRWLAPESARSVARYVAGTADYWDWWAGLDEVTRHGRPVGHHDAPPGDPYWRRYILGQRDLARLSAAEVARKLPLPRGARSLLDIGGGHGWHSAELCRRHPGMTATVLDLPGAAAIGREVIAAAGLSDRVRHVDGDATVDDLGTGYDAVLCFNLVHHLAPKQVTDVFTKVRRALVPGGILAVMDAFADPGAAPRHRAPAQVNLLGLFTYLSSGSQSRTPEDLRGWLRAAGFEMKPRKLRVLGIPGQGLYVAKR